jgi:uncharacterized protein YjdB
MKPLKKQKKIMKTKNMIWAALSMTAALVMTACSNDDNTVETPTAQQAIVKTIPYSVTVGQGGDATTRATVESNLKTLKFATGDQLYISSDSRTDLKGTLTLKAGDEGKSNGATFEGSITYTGDAPEGTTEIKATLVGSSNVGVQITDGKVTGVSYPSDAYCDDVAEAVQKYSNLTGTSTYSSKSFKLSQQTAFLNFEITFVDGTAENTTLSTVVNNNSTDICTANVKTKKDGEKVVAKFVLPVASGTTLSSATVKMGDKEAISFGASQTLTGKVYNVKKTRDIPVSSVAINNAPTEALFVNSKGTLTATVLPDNATDKTVTWSSSDPDYVSINATTGEYVVMGKKGYGSATITATAGGKTATCIITGKVTYTSLSAGTVLHVGDTFYAGSVYFNTKPLMSFIASNGVITLVEATSGSSKYYKFQRGSNGTMPNVTAYKVKDNTDGVYITGGSGTSQDRFTLAVHTN